jgi:hypothetical protein
MIVHPSRSRPWDIARAQTPPPQGLPDLNDLDDDPQLGPVALLQATATVTVSALLAQHGAGRRIPDELTDSPDCIVAVLARLLVLRCEELAELLAAYRLALQQQQSAADDIADHPF